MTGLKPVDVNAPVSVVMTVRNEQAHLAQAVASVLDNGFDPGVTVVIAVGPSDDDTERIAADLARDPRVVVVDNPHGGTPQGLNAALKLTTTDVIVRMDGHGELPHGYIARAVAALAQTGAANVGGRMVPDADQPFARAVAVAMKSKWGLGGGGHRVGGKAGPADSVFLGTFRRDAIEEMDGFDEHFARAQDWELNFRLRQAGYTVWFDPELAVAYRPRGDARHLARQFYRTGQWRREVMRVHGVKVSVKYLAPPVAVLALVVGTLLALAGFALNVPLLWWGLAVPGAYLAGVLAVSARLARRAGWPAAWWLPGVLMVMHMAWGTGFLRGVR